MTAKRPKHKRGKRGGRKLRERRAQNDGTIIALPIPTTTNVTALRKRLALLAQRPTTGA